jgi:hypothetical protein
MQIFTTTKTKSITRQTVAVARYHDYKLRSSNNEQMQTKKTLSTKLFV